MKKFLLFAAAILALVSCNEEVEMTQDLEVRLDPIITRALSLNFNEGDEIGVNIKMDEDQSVYASNARFTYAGGVFEGDLKWYKDGAKTSSLTAWYPYMEGGFPTEFSVELDQSEGTNASDFMIAKESKVYPSSSPVLAKFRHQFSQLNISVKADFDVAVESVTVKNIVPTAVISTESDGSVSIAPKAGAQLADIVAEEIEPNKLYSAVVVPQSLENFGLAVSVKNGSTILSGIKDAVLKSGYSYTIVVTVTADQVTAAISGEIEAWGDGGTLNGGDYEVPFQEFDGYFIYDGVRYNTVVINGRTWMASSLAFLPLGASPSSDPSQGSVFYPYAIKDGVPVALTDAESVKKLGYLYTHKVAFGKEVTSEDFHLQEGIQGICPKGWHIPTRAEMYALCGASNRSYILNETGNQTDPNAYLWDPEVNYSTVAKYNAAGFNYTFSGMQFNGNYNKTVISASNSTEESYYGNLAVTYYLCSTAAQKVESSGTLNYFVQMTTFTKTMYGKGRVSLSYMGYGKGATALRCIKDVASAQ